MANFESMIKMFYPDAISGVDYTLDKDDENGSVYISEWNEKKLGPKPNEITLHSGYMKEIAKKKELIPTTDIEDPAPWLNSPEEKANMRRIAEPSFHIPIVNVDPKTGSLIL